MKHLLYIFLAAITLYIAACKPNACPKALFTKDTTFKSERNNSMFVFVGERINILDTIARYKVLQRIYGCYAQDTITFTPLSAYGWHEDFGLHETAMLYVIKKENEYRIWRFDNVYMTKSGKWASPYLSQHANDYVRLKITPRRVDFTNEVVISTEFNFDYETEEYLQYSHPFYWTTGNKTIADYGIFAEDLFTLKKETVLTEAGYFGPPEPDIEDETLMATDIQLEEVMPEENKFGERLNEFYQPFFEHAIVGNATSIKNTLLDSLWICGSLYTREKFLSKCYPELFDTSMLAKHSLQSPYTFERTQADFKELLPCAKKRILKDDGDYYLYRFKMLRYHKVFPDTWLVISCIDTKNGFRVYDIRYENNISCCY